MIGSNERGALLRLRRCRLAQRARQCNDPVVVIQPDVRVRLPFDAPTRVLFWGVLEAPFKLTVSPVLDVHTGFPYSVVDEYRQYIGRPDSLRLPRFVSLNLQVTRPFTVRLGSPCSIC